MTSHNGDEGSRDLAGPEGGPYMLRLYVTGMTPRSIQAITNMRRICDEHLKGMYELEVIDIYQHPEAAAEAQLLAAPTMIKQLPAPLRRFVGDMSDEEKILVGLDVRPKKELPPDGQ
jgi:circadian clock protein KaiB